MPAQRVGTAWREAGVRKPAGDETAVGQEGCGRIDPGYGDLGARLRAGRPEGLAEAAILGIEGVAGLVWRRSDALIRAWTMLFGGRVETKQGFAGWPTEVETAGGSWS